MTSSAISEVSSKNSSNIMMKKARQDTEDFMSSLQNALSQPNYNFQNDNSNEIKTDEIDKTKGVVVKREYETKTNDTKTNETNIGETATEETNVEDVKEDDELSEEAVDEIVELLSKELGISVEQVNQLLEENNMTPADLLNNSKLLDFVQAKLGIDDSVLVTDENLLQEITELVNDLSDKVESIVSANSDDMISNQLNSSEFIQGMELKGAESEATKVSIVVIEDTTKDVKLSSENTESVSTQLDAMDESSITNSENGTLDSEQQNSGFLNQSQGGVQLQNVTNAMEVEMPIESYIDTDDIIQQIADYVKIQKSSDLTSVEMTLHPETLGNVHLQVSQKEGLLTASIITENAAVKDALSVQMIALKEQLNEQGLKIQEVEVTVASHQFERNMQDGGSESKQLYEQSVQKQSRRRIMLQGETILEEDMSEADKLQVDIMRKDGNSIDFSA